MAETNKREVNADTEVINAENIPDSGDDLDEEVIPPVEDDDIEEEKPDKTPTDDEPEDNSDDTKAPTDSSPEGADPDAEPESAPSKQPAPVPGETPREKALRLEVQRLRGIARQSGIKDLIGDDKPGVKAPAQLSERMEKLRETYSDEEIRNMEEAIDVLAESKGYVKADQSYQTTVNDVVENFIEDNQEYKPENDPEDVRWNRFQGILKSGIYNITGKTQKQLRHIFNKVNADVISELGEPTAKTEVKREAAQRQKIKSVSHSGGTKPQAPKDKPKIDPTVRGMFKGFDDEDFE